MATNLEGSTGPLHFQEIPFLFVNASALVPGRRSTAKCSKRLEETVSVDVYCRPWSTYIRSH
jgi:hypothetical protein